AGLRALTPPPSWASRISSERCLSDLGADNIFACPRDTCELLDGPRDWIHSVLPHPGPLPWGPWGEGEWSTASRSQPGRSLPNNHRLTTNSRFGIGIPSPCRRRAGAALWRATKAEERG